VLEITSNDPDTPVTAITVTATSSLDSDGVADSIEAAAPNNGDGNGDGIPDTQQANVTSLPDINGGYVTLESTAGTRLSTVTAHQTPTPGTTPTADGGSLNFPNGFFSFIIENVPVGGSATVTLSLPARRSASTYFKFGRLSNEPALSMA
jgi:hypothetical protein